MVARSEIGITGDFESPIPGPNPGARASGEVRPLGYVGEAPLVVPSKSGLHYFSTVLPAPCRGCGGPSWLSDDSGAVHPCCELNGQPCVACRASETLNREHRRRGARTEMPIAPAKVYFPPYEIGDCSTCPRTSVRFYQPYQCFFCVRNGIAPEGHNGHGR